MANKEGSGSSGVEVTLRRDLGLLEVLMIGIGPNIGSTIFVLVGIAIGIAGPAILLALVLNFFITLLTAMSYAELSSAFPETGGGYLWIKEALFPPMGFLGGWMSWVGHCIACAVYALGFGLGVSALFVQYGISFFGISSEMISKLFAVGISAFFIFLNYRGVKGAGKSEVIISAMLLGIIVIYMVFCIIALLSGNGVQNAFEPFIPMGYMSIATSMGFTFMIFEGYEIVAQTGEETKDPERTVPRAMFLCITISAILFITITALTIAVMGWQPIAQLAAIGKGQEALVVASQKVVPVFGGAIISVGIIIGSIAAVNSVIFSSSRVSFAMGRDGNLPVAFGKLNRKNHTPSVAIFLSGGIIIFASAFLPIAQVAAVADILILLLFILVNISAIALRWKRPDAKRHFLIPLFPVLPLIAIGAKVFLAASLFNFEPLAWYIALAVIYSGLLIHYFAKGRKEIEKIEVPARMLLTPEELRKFRVLIPVDDVRNVGLIDLGCIVAAKNHGEILLTNIVEVPTAVPIDAVDRKVVEERKKMLEKLKVYAELRGVPTRALVSVSHDIVTAIIDTAKEEAANMIILGWKGYTRTKKRIFGRKLDDILRGTPCDVIVMRDEEKLRPENILVLSGGLWHVSKATEIAAEIARVAAARVTILNVIVDERYRLKAIEYSKRLMEIVQSAGVQVITKEIRPETIVGGVVAESMDYDLLVIGVSARRHWKKFVFGPTQDKIVQNAKCPVLIYERVAGSELTKRPTESNKREEIDR
ncbi:MAG: amino acid permease [Methanomassiliicoccales archaeon]|nr:amino acid permease [Methanomassiliicoccales archaeon]